jgi:hypothetical protein
MAMDKNVGQREYDKFVESSDGLTAIRVQTVDNADVPITIALGQFEQLLQVNQLILNELKLMNVHLMLASNFEGEV